MRARQDDATAVSTLKLNISKSLTPYNAVINEALEYPSEASLSVLFPSRYPA